MNRKVSQAGMTLIEIMIALLIGVFLLAGVMQIFINSKQTYRTQENLSRLQENGRFAMEYLSRDIRMAGYWGCLDKSTVTDDVGGADNNTVSSDNIDNGTDTLTLKGAFNIRPVGTFIPIPIGTCGSIKPDAANSCDSNGDNAVDTICSTHASSTINYRINSSFLQRTDTAGVYQNLIEGIENIQILYGVDTDGANTPNFGTPNFYVAANAVTNWAQVVSIRITITVRTIDDKLTETGDGRIRRDFTSTIALRNRLQ